MNEKNRYIPRPETNSYEELKEIMDKILESIEELFEWGSEAFPDQQWSQAYNLKQWAENHFTPNKIHNEQIMACQRKFEEKFRLLQHQYANADKQFILFSDDLLSDIIVNKNHIMRITHMSDGTIDRYTVTMQDMSIYSISVPKGTIQWYESVVI